MTGKIPLSVVVLTKNEEERICDCLDTVAWAGEIVVVDDESTDRTRELVRRYTDKIYTRKMDVEGRHRNYAYSLASLPWVLSLDADERVTDPLREEVIRTVQADRSHAAFSIPRKNYIGDVWIRHGGWYPSAQLKLFRKGQFRFEESEVHPVVFVDGKVGCLESDLIHYSYRDVGDFLQKMNNHTSREAQKWFRDGRRMGLGKCLWRTLDRFFRSYALKQGFRDGIHGLIVAVFAGLYQLVSYAKYLELKKGKIGEG